MTDGRPQIPTSARRVVEKVLKYIKYSVWPTGDDSGDSNEMADSETGETEAPPKTQVETETGAETTPTVGESESDKTPESVCEVCGREFKNARGVAIHAGRMHKDRDGEDDEDTEPEHVIFTSGSQIWHHPDPNDPEAPKCDRGRDGTVWKRTAIEHTEQRDECRYCSGGEEGQPVTCPECGEDFNTASGYKQHYGAKHSVGAALQSGDVTPEDLGLSPIGERRPVDGGES